MLHFILHFSLSWVQTVASETLSWHDVDIFEETKLNNARTTWSYWNHLLFIWHTRTISSLLIGGGPQQRLRFCWQFYVITSQCLRLLHQCAAGGRNWTLINNRSVSFEINIRIIRFARETHTMIACTHICWQCPHLPPFSVLKNISSEVITTQWQTERKKVNVLWKGGTKRLQEYQHAGGGMTPPPIPLHRFPEPDVSSPGLF